MSTYGIRPFGRALLALPVVATLTVGACDFLDPTEVENPQTTTEDLARAQRPTEALLPGIRTQFARALGSVMIVTENVSDNYSIHGTGLDKQYDEPRAVQPSVVNSTTSTTGAYWNLQELRALGDFVLETIVPGDTTATQAQIAEVQFYRGMAFLMQAENFVAVPLEVDGQPVPAAQLGERAIADLEQAVQGGMGPAALASLARAYRLAGNEAQAEALATQALAADPEFVFVQEYDQTSIENPAWFFVVIRQLQEMQPLPRLDFLDPKFTTEESGIPFAKAEEMHLILAEVELERSNLTAARQHLAEAIQLAQSRSTAGINDPDPRLNADLSIRPRDAEILVAACPSCPLRAGLVLNRPGPVTVPAVSGTSLDADSVVALTAELDIRHALHLARQEILFLEGRRMSDLGIRLPMMLREVDANASVEEGDLGTVAVVPDYIPPRDDMDLFTPASPYSEESLQTTEVVILVDMNRVLADNMVSPLR